MAERDAKLRTVGGQGAEREFILLLTSSQKMLYAYIATILRGAGVADDVLQSTNLKALEKCGQFELGTNFGAWIRTIAFHQIQDHWKKDRRVSELETRLRLAGIVTEHFVDREREIDDRFSALEYCLTLLPVHQRSWVEKKYRDGQSLSEIAAAKNCSVASVSQALYRIRRTLRRCVGVRIASGGGGGRDE